MVDKKVVESSRAAALAEEYGIKFLETSAKNNINVDQAFYTIARDIKKRLMDTQESHVTEKTGIKLNDQNKEKKKGKCC